MTHELKVKLVPEYPGQAWIEGGAAGAPSYFSVHGVYGEHGPHVFAAAPELLEAAKSALFVLTIVYQREPGTNEAGAIAGLQAAIAKAEGRS